MSDLSSHELADGLRNCQSQSSFHSDLMWLLTWSGPTGDAVFFTGFWCHLSEFFFQQLFFIYFVDTTSSSPCRRGCSSGCQPQSSLCVLRVLTGDSHSCTCSQTHICTLHFPPGLQVADTCLQDISVLMSHQARSAMCQKQFSSFCCHTDLPPVPPPHLGVWHNHRLCCAAQKPAVSVLVAPKVLPASNSCSPSLQKWAFKTANISFHTPLSLSLSSFHPIPFFLPNFQIFQWFPSTSGWNF